jgi:hypothetical protein
MLSTISVTCHNRRDFIMKPKPQKYVCHKCGSENMHIEADVEWNTTTQTWDVGEVTWEECRDCNDEGVHEMTGVFVDDDSLKTIVLQTIHKEENQ